MLAPLWIIHQFMSRLFFSQARYVQRMVPSRVAEPPPVASKKARTAPTRDVPQCRRWVGVLRGKAGSPPNPGEGSRAQLAAPWRGLGRHRGPRFRKRRRLRPPTYRLGRPARPRAALPFSGPSSLQTQRDTCRGLAPPDDFLKKSGLEILNLSPLPPPKICQDLMRLVGVLESDPLPASTRR